MEILEVLRRPNKWEFSSRSSFVLLLIFKKLCNDKFIQPQALVTHHWCKNIDFDSFKPSEEPR